MTKFTKSVLATASLVALGATANAQVTEFDLNTLVVKDLCTVADAETQMFMNAKNDKEFARATKQAKSQRAQRQRPFLKDVRFQKTTQVVFLDFGSEDPTFTVSVNGNPFGSGSLIDGERTPGVYADFDYDREARAFILDSMRQDFAAFNFRFTDVEPRRGDYSTIRIGDNDANPIDLAGGILFGRADGIDHGNLNRNDNAFADASLWQFFAEFDATDGGNFLQRFSTTTPESTEEEIRAAGRMAAIQQSANTGAHELGHVLGLRHLDSFGGIGEGLPPARSGGEFWPNRPDLNRLAIETLDHLMASGASTGLSLAAPAAESRFLGERTANKLTFNERGRTYLESALKRSRGFLPFSNSPVPNTIEEGVNARGRFKVRNVRVAGSLEERGEIDTYQLNLRRGDVFSAEGISWTDDTLSFPDETLAGMQISLFKVGRRGERELIELNQTTFESFDPMLLDVEIEESGRYELDITVPELLITNGGAGGFDLEGFPPNRIFRTGKYQLWAYTISTPLSPAQRGIGGQG